MNEDERLRHIHVHNKMNSWWLLDARGIECCRVCDECEDAARARYNPEIFDGAKYDQVVEEPVEPEEGYPI